jgi:hypothetical protein
MQTNCKQKSRGYGQQTPRSPIGASETTWQTWCVESQQRQCEVLLSMRLLRRSKNGSKNHRRRKLDNSNIKQGTPKARSKVNANKLQAEIKGLRSADSKKSNWSFRNNLANMVRGKSAKAVRGASFNAITKAIEKRLQKSQKKKAGQ